MIAAADFFTTEVWTVRGLVTYDTPFVIELASRRVHLVGATPHLDEAFVLQIARTVTNADDGAADGGHRLLASRAGRAKNSAWLKDAKALEMEARQTSRKARLRTGPSPRLGSGPCYALLRPVESPTSRGHPASSAGH